MNDEQQVSGAVKPKQERRIASVSFSSKKPLERKAYRVFQEWRQKPNPDDDENPESKMTAQQILITALIALGAIGDKPRQPERIEVPVPDERVRDELSQFKDQVAQGLLHINKTLVDIQKRVSLMAEDGRLTKDQAQQVMREIDAQSITDEFAKNIQTTYKPGRKPKR